MFTQGIKELTDFLGDWGTKLKCYTAKSHAAVRNAQLHCSIGTSAPSVGS